MSRPTLSLLLVSLLAVSAVAVESPVDAPPRETDPSIGGVFYLGYKTEDAGEGEHSEFFLRRSYLTVKKQVLPFLDARITLDASQDLEGQGLGDLEVRIKYAHGRFKLPDFGPFGHQSVELGVVHGPWLAFEETVNRYRMRDKMFVERSGVLNSADFGVTYSAWLGGSLDEEYRSRVNSKFAGRYGSLAVGVYNGGGYHSVEANENKVVEARLSVRPLFNVLPGLQLSGFGVFGEGNSLNPAASSPDWTLWLAMLSYEHPRVSATAQLVFGEGNQKGTWVDPVLADPSLDYSGYALFGELKPFGSWRVIGGYDWFDLEQLSAYRDVYGGVGYDFGRANILLFDYTMRSYEQSGLENEYWYQLTMQVKY